jgi:uncharacterized membrane-anchored protein YhcB (DUF1043 family)
VEAPEVSYQILLIAGTCVALLGLLLGWLIGRRTSNANLKYREIERRLDQVLQDKKVYEDDVVAHFSETAQLLNNLTESYRDVHNHLANGAATLCEGEGPVALGRLRNDPESSDIPGHLVDIQPPLDYAPKTSPDEKGMLSEKFGLEPEKQPTEPQEAEKT